MIFQNLAGMKIPAPKYTTTQEGKLRISMLRGIYNLSNNKFLYCLNKLAKKMNLRPIDHVNLQYKTLAHHDVLDVGVAQSSKLQFKYL